ncbi:MAG: hypothetical protein IJ728_10395 [Selenomonadaceae bacterium]|nr:hypothetical protein [Selenomonadaceae bacterium]
MSIFKQPFNQNRPLNQNQKNSQQNYDSDKDYNKQNHNYGNDEINVDDDDSGTDD